MGDLELINPLNSPDCNVSSAKKSHCVPFLSGWIEERKIITSVFIDIILQKTSDANQFYRMVLKWHNWIEDMCH
jgi:hypothetical protein